MNAKTRAGLLILSHAVLIGAGYAWHRGAASPSRAAAEKAPTPANPPADVSPPASSGPSTGGWNSGQYRKAWAALGTASLSTQERAQLHAKLLKEWMEVDLHGALVAWSQESNDATNSRLGTLIAADAFKGREEEALQWILSGDFGLDGMQVLEVWKARVGADPALLLSLAAKTPPAYREWMLRGPFNLPMNDAQGAVDAMVGAISASQDARLKELAWRSLLDGLSRSPSMDSGRRDIFYQLLGRDDIPAAAREAGLSTLAELMMMNTQPVFSSGEFGKLSAADQSTTAGHLLDRAKSVSFARPLLVPQVIDFLVETNQWDTISRTGPEAIASLTKNRDMKADTLGRWAMELPAREETAGIFRAAVAPSLKQNREAAIGWAAGLEEGWHRDQAYAQLAKTADGQYKDAALRDQAIGSISNPAVRTELEQWRQTSAKAR